jgi:hypothetical protein
MRQREQRKRTVSIDSVGPRLVEGDPMLDSIAKGREADGGVEDEVVDCGGVEPALARSKKTRNKR